MTSAPNPKPQPVHPRVTSANDAREAALFQALRRLSTVCSPRGRRILFAFYAGTL